MYVLRLRLRMGGADRRFAERCFAAVNKLHNTLVKHAQKLLGKLRRDREYQGWLSELIAIKKRKPDRRDRKRAGELGRLLAARRKEIGLTQYGLGSWCVVWRKRYTRLVSGHQADAEVARVWKGVEATLFSDGKRLRFRKLPDMKTIGNTDNGSGVIFDPGALRIRWLGRCMACEAKPNDPYVEEALRNARQDTHKGVDKDRIIRHCMVERLPMRGGWRYYALVVLAGDAPLKGRTLGKGRMGVDPGVSTVAAVADNDVFLEELAPKARDYDRKILDITRRMDASKRSTNPDNYNEDGTVKKGPKSWRFTNNYKKLRWRLRDLHRRKSAYVTQSHAELANRMAASAGTFLIEKNNFAAMARRAKKTVRSDTMSVVAAKDGSEKTVRKFKRKKRLGRSIRDRSPSLLLTILERKALALGGAVQWIDPFVFKASQYRHDTDGYVKVPLSRRTKIISNRIVQRDLYSAFLIKHSDPGGSKPNREACVQNFIKFCELQDGKIQKMKEGGITMKQCFGF